MAITTKNESLRLEILQEISNCIDTLKKLSNSLSLDITECIENQDRWPPSASYLRNKTYELEKWLQRYDNIVDLRRMPNDHGDAATRRALEKVGFRYYSGTYKDQTYIRGYLQLIDLEYPDVDGKECLNIENFTVTYHGAHYGDALWTLKNPSAGEVLTKLGLELPFE